MATEKGDEAETQEEEEDDDEQEDIGSEISLNSSTQENIAYTNRETGSTDQFGVVRTISKSANETNQSGDFVTALNWEVQSGKNIIARTSDQPVDREANYEETSRQIKRLESRPAPSYLEQAG